MPRTVSVGFMTIPMPYFAQYASAGRKPSRIRMPLPEWHVGETRSTGTAFSLFEVGLVELVLPGYGHLEVLLFPSPNPHESGTRPPHQILPTSESHRLHTSAMNERGLLLPEKW